MYSSELIKGTLKTLILEMLRREGRMYGYELTQKVRQMSDGKICLTEGALYPTLHGLQAKGLLSAESVLIGKRARKYYSLTQKGVVESAAKTNEFMDFLTVMQHLLAPKAAH